MSDRPTFDSLATELRKAWGIPDGPLPEVKPFDVAAAVRQQRMDAFRRMCPKEFQQRVDRAKIPNIAAWDDADSWDGSFPGVWLWSKETGEAKTRMLWRKFGQLHVERGLTIQRITGLNLAEEYHDSHLSNRTAAFYRHMCGVEVVMLDDLDKMALPDEGMSLSERAEANRNARMLRELFDTFYEEHTRVLVTANEPISWFGERIGESGERRMRAVCREVAF